MKNSMRLALASLSLLGCNATPATNEDDGLGGFNGQGGFPGGSYNQGAYGGYNPGGNNPGGNNPGGYNPGGGGYVPGGGGYVPGGGGYVPGGGGYVPGGGGYVPGGGGYDPGGAPSTGGVPSPVDPIGNQNRAPGFINLAPPPGAPFPAQGTALTPPPPDSWQYHPIEGGVCRDGSPMGIFVRTGTVNQLLIFLEGGGACSNVGFCRFNPKNVTEVLAGDGSTVIGTAAGAVNESTTNGRPRQQPGSYSGNVPAGIFDHSNAANPFKDWNMVYIPYCTGDVHYGTRANATVPGTPGADARDLQQHQFVGYFNMQKIVGRVVPTFPTSTRVVVAGSSAGSFGAALSFSMIQDAFGDIPVTVVGDSGVPLEDQYMPACMQKNWRQAWGIAFPPDCTECQSADGGGMLGMADFLMRKHPKAKVGLISTMEDEVIRLFFSVGLANCANYQTADPVAITLAQIDPTQYMPAAQYSGGVSGVRAKYQSTQRLATYFMAGQLHQHIFRPSFYTTQSGGMTPATFVKNFLDGTVAQVGP